MLSEIPWEVLMSRDYKQRLELGFKPHTVVRLAILSYGSRNTAIVVFGTTLERMDHHCGEDAGLPHRIPRGLLLCHIFSRNACVGLCENTCAGTDEGSPIGHGPAVSVGFFGMVSMIPALKLLVEVDRLLKGALHLLLII